MGWWRHVTRGLRVLTNRRAADRDLDAEVDHYMDQAIEMHVADGLPPEEARRRARLEVGNPAALKEQVRDAGWERLVETTLADVRFAVRLLRRSPVFTAVVLLLLSLGGGAVSTIFSAMNATVLRPIPGVDDPSRIVSLEPARPDGTAAEQGSYALYTELRDGSTLLSGVGAWGRVALTIAADGAGVSAFGQMVSGNYFDVLGVRPALGRFFVAEEDRTPRSHPVIVLSHAFWMTHVGGDERVLGRTVMVNGHPFTVVGVASPGFVGIYTGVRADAWVPLMMQPVLRPRSNLTSASWLWMFGRLRPGFEAPAVQAELAALLASRNVESGQSGKPPVFTTVRVSRLTGLPGDVRRPMLGFMSALLGASSLVLLIAGINVAGLLSARYAARRRELAVRAALGAGRARLLRQIMTEVLVLFAGGAFGGFGLAALATAALERLPLPANVPVVLELSPDARVLVFAIGISLAAGAIFGLAPAVQAVRADIAARFRDDATQTSRIRPVMSRLLMVGQLALSLVLLVTAGLFVRALDRGQQVDPGFESTGVAVTMLEPESWGFDHDRARVFYRTLREHLHAAPDVTAVSFTGRVPLMLGSSVDDITVDDASQLSIHYASIDVGYFDVLKLPILSGRRFTARDDEAAAHVAVVNETLARRLSPDGTALGRTFRFRNRITTVVGIARDAKYASLQEATPPFAYFPLAQVWQPTQALLVRSVADSGQAIRAAMRSIDPLLPPPRVTTLREVTAIVLFPQRAAAIVTGMLGMAGIILAAAGLYGIIAFSAHRRTREIGIRVALGAGRSTVLVMMLREGLQLAFAGILLGLILSAAATRVLQAWLFGVSPLDGTTFLGMSTLFLLVVTAAVYLPAQRAASLDPLAALRVE